MVDARQLASVPPPPRRPRTHLRLVPGGAGTSARAWAADYRARLVVCDVLVVAVTAFAAFEAALLVAGRTAPVWSTAALAIIAAAVWISALAALHTRDERLFAVGAEEYKRLMSASTIAIGVIAIAFLSLDAAAPSAYLLVAWAIGVPVLLVERWSWRRWLNHERRAGRSISRAIVVGDAEDVAQVIAQMSRCPAVYAIVGVAVDGLTARTSLPVGERTFPVVATPGAVVGAAERIGAQTIVVAGTASGGPSFVKRLAWQLEGTSIELVLAARLTEVAGPRIHFQIIDDLPLMHVDIPRFEGGKHVAKRGLDIVGSASALILLAPLFLAIAIAIRFDDGGPAIFRQERVGRGGRTFTLLKFRSMVPTAEQDLAALAHRDEGNGVLFKLRDDPRVTRAGRVLRRYSLDEFPQFWNVLVGDMSLVGPRPPLASEVEGYEAHVRRRLYLKPGLTGPWQVGGRSDLAWEESVRLDLHYIENWSLIGDVMLLWRTLYVMVHPVGAY
ncbi:sugar transferase [Agromyces sp. PvR057]|uniref:sugar transferase n=1 Tax=Agromyces sp. PvR057 TaxID=3156403 RepID=UPI000E3659A4